MYKISLLDISDLDEAYEIEVLTNPSPWSFDNFKSSFEVGHHGLVCKEDNKMLGFLIFSPIKPEAHLLSIAVIKTQQSKGMGSLLLKSIFLVKRYSLLVTYADLKKDLINAHCLALTDHRF